MTPFSLNIRGRLVNYRQPVVMGILNVTSDSFFPGSRCGSCSEVAERVRKMVEQGADIIDVGACSTRPGSEPVSADVELRRLETAMTALRSVAPEIPVSVDTFRADVAREAVNNLSADIINDISGGSLDRDMFGTVADLKVPYILTHTRGTSANMGQLTDYGERGVTATVLDELGLKLNELALMGVNDIIIDPGFGFAKTVSQNYTLMRDLAVFKQLRMPLLAGISRKSMLTRPLGIEADDALEPTVALNAFALDRGADILRVHDVLPARQSCTIYNLIHNS
ncbi:MAG: dihydropteroate synthase [Muribaculaceae bacterium]|nr:dihydropteroate synthase [Muribaculaceae bacterium]